MTTEQAIAEHVAALSEDAQREVLDFVRFLQSRKRAGDDTDEYAWSAFSLASAMRGMEDEPSPYTIDDLKEHFT